MPSSMILPAKCAQHNMDHTVFLVHLVMSMPIMLNFQKVCTPFFSYPSHLLLSPCHLQTNHACLYVTTLEYYIRLPWNTAHDDLISVIYSLLHHLIVGITLTFQHVKGYQDQKMVVTHLLHLAQLNVLADPLANKALLALPSPALYYKLGQA